MPQWFAALMEKKPTGGTQQIGHGDRSAAARTTYAARALESEIGRLLLAPEGDRNGQLNRSAFALGQLVGGGALDAGQVVDALVIAARRTGLGESELEDTIGSGLRSGIAKPRKVPT